MTEEDKKEQPEQLPKLEPKSQEELQAAVKTVQSKVLASYVVAYRTLGYNKQLAILCMSELARRRKEGEDFEYEKFIDEEIQKVPKLQNLNLQSVMPQLLNIKSVLSKIKVG